jgi:hypothetical protein
MIPHERSLVAKMKDEPFALVGVNTDPIDTVKAGVAREKMSWRHFWDGSGGPICMGWNVHSFPTIFILDANGVIRARDLRDDAMEKKVEELLAEMKAGKMPSKDGASGSGATPKSGG